MKRLLIIFALAFVGMSLHAADGELFPYPKPTDDMVSLNERCDFLVSHFWDRCDFKGAMSKKAALSNTFGDWVSFMPFASADTVHSAIDRLLASVAKSGDYTLELGKLAQQWAHSDSADIYSDEIFYPFAKAVATNKKIKEDDRRPFRIAAQKIDNVQRGKKVEHLNFVTPAGQAKTLDDFHTQMIAVVFGRYDSDAANLARIRLSADINATALIRAGLLTVIYLQPEGVTDEWKAAAATFPEDWVVGASADAREYFPLRSTPAIYLLDARHRLLLQEPTVDGMLNLFSQRRHEVGL